MFPNNISPEGWNMRLKTGITGLDTMLEGGLLKNQVYIISGPPGSGRTTLGIQFLVAGAMQNEKGLYVALTDSPTNIIKHMSRYSFNLVNYVKAKQIYFMDGTQELFEETKKKPISGEANIFELAAEAAPQKDFFEKIEPIIKKAGITRLVIDSMTALSFLSKSRDKDAKKMAKYINTLKHMEVTSLLLSERFEQGSYCFEHYFCHGIIEMHHLANNEITEPSRAIQILKMRGTKHDNLLHPLSFTDHGLNVITK
jgi:KaiC/GvpD/RAD55 family RecA-like ATPase